MKKAVLTFMMIFWVLVSCSPSPRRTVQGFFNSLEKGELEKAYSYLAEDSEYEFRELLKTAIVYINNLGEEDAKRVRENISREFAGMNLRILDEKKISSREAIVKIVYTQRNWRDQVVMDTSIVELHKIDNRWFIYRELMP